MDLVYHLLSALSDYDSRLWAMARFRSAVYQHPSTDTEMRILMDRLCIRFFFEEIILLLPEDESGDDATLAKLTRRDEIVDILDARGILKDNAVLSLILGWAGAMVFGRWGDLPWHRLLTEIDDYLEEFNATDS